MKRATASAPVQRATNGSRMGLASLGSLIGDMLLAQTPGHARPPGQAFESTYVTSAGQFLTVIRVWNRIPGSDRIHTPASQKPHESPERRPSGRRMRQGYFHTASATRSQFSPRIPRMLASG